MARGRLVGHIFVPAVFEVSRSKGRNNYKNVHKDAPSTTISLLLSRFFETSFLFVTEQTSRLRNEGGLRKKSYLGIHDAFSMFEAPGTHAKS